MTITRQSLMKLVEEKVEQSVRSTHDLIAVFLCGSLNQDQGELALGGAADVDLVFVHDFEPAHEREFVPLNPDIHMDILHHSRTRYRQPRELRLDPYQGYMVYYGKIMHDPRHLLDFAQAGVRDRFFRADTVVQRAERALSQARQLASPLFASPGRYSPEGVHVFFTSLSETVETAAVLAGQPLTTRRMLAELPQRAQAVDAPGLVAGFAGLFGAGAVDAVTARSWIAGWEQAFSAITELDYAPPTFHPCRSAYYRKAAEHFLSAGQVGAAIWPLIKTWTDAARFFPPDDPIVETWYMVMDRLGLGEEMFPAKIQGLAAYQETMAETIARWAQKKGL